jgi:hypothetical protein
MNLTEDFLEVLLAYCLGFVVVLYVQDLQLLK